MVDIVLRRVRWTVGTLALATLVSLLILPASVQAKPTVLGEYYQETTTERGRLPPAPSDCSDVSFCYYIFARVPRGKFLVVTNVSCTVLVGGADDFRLAKIVPQRGDGTILPREHHFAPIQTSFDTQPNNFYIIQGTTSQLIKENERPLIYMETLSGSLFEGSCTIEGKLLDAP